MRRRLRWPGDSGWSASQKLSGVLYVYSSDLRNQCQKSPVLVGKGSRATSEGGLGGFRAAWEKQGGAMMELDGATRKPQRESKKEQHGAVQRHRR